MAHARKSADSRKTEIIAAMLRLADELGPDRLTTNDVAKAVGLTQPGIFRHFATKQALWQAVADQIASQMTVAWAVVLAQNLDPLPRIEALLRVQLRQISQTPAIPAILHSRELQLEKAALRTQFFALMTQFQGHLVEALTEGRALGVFRGDPLPKDSAVLLISVIQGLAIHWAMGQRAFSLEVEGGRLLACQIGLLTALQTLKDTP